jgi:GNAT superfamily N-acetyltransferase
MVLFSCRLPLDRLNPTAGVCVERVGAATISKEDYAVMLGVWDPTIRSRQFAERFQAGSELWLAKVDGKLAGSGWTIQGRTIAPYFFRLQPGDVHLYDFLVLPQFRGRGVNVLLVMDILARLGAEQVHRAYIECALWNHAQLRSMAKTAFRRYAEATKMTILGHSLVIWHRFE